MREINHLEAGPLSPQWRNAFCGCRRWQGNRDACVVHRQLLPQRGDGARWENRAAALSARQLIRESCARYRLCRTSLQSIISRTRLRISNEEIRGLARLRPLIEKCPAGPGFGSEEGADRARCSRCVYLSPPAGAVHRCSFSAWPSIWARAARAAPPDELEP